MRRVLFIASGLMLLWSAVPARQADVAPAAPVEAWEDRVFEMARAQEVVGRELRAKFEAFERALHRASDLVG